MNIDELQGAWTGILTGMQPLVDALDELATMITFGRDHGPAAIKIMRRYHTNRKRENAWRRYCRMVRP